MRSLMAEAFVHGDYHACKMELSEEARMDKVSSVVDVSDLSGRLR